MGPYLVAFHVDVGDVQVFQMLETHEGLVEDPGEGVSGQTEEAQVVHGVPGGTSKRE